MLIEWIELHALLGVGEIFLYVDDDDDALAGTDRRSYISKVLESYANDTQTNGVQLTVIRWQSALDDGIVSSVDDDEESANDCVNRASLRHRYVAVSRQGEVLVPRRPGGWPRFVADVAANASGVGAFLFRHVYFRRNVTWPSYRLPGTSAYLVTMQYLWRPSVVAPPATRDRCKV